MNLFLDCYDTGIFSTVCGMDSNHAKQCGDTSGKLAWDWVHWGILQKKCIHFWVLDDAWFLLVFRSSRKSCLWLTLSCVLSTLRVLSFLVLFLLLFAHTVSCRACGVAYPNCQVLSSSTMVNTTSLGANASAMYPQITLPPTPQIQGPYFRLCRLFSL